MCSTSNISSESQCDCGVEDDDIDRELADLLQTVDFSKSKATPEKCDDDGSEMKVRFVKCKASENKQKDVSDEERSSDHGDDLCDDFTELMQGSTVVQNQLKQRTGGRITSARCPCFGGGMNASMCSTFSQQNWSKRRKSGHGPPCCFNIHPDDIDARLRGVTSHARRKGVDVCYRAYEEPKNDVFFVSIKNRKQSESPKTSIEIELRTPKPPCRDWPLMWAKHTMVEKKLLKGGGKKKKKKNK